MKFLETLEPFDEETEILNVIIDTPKGCRNKYAFDFEAGSYKLKTVLPQGAVFPFDFGSIPGTKGEDGDPLDALVLMDEPAFPGCLVEARAIGVIEAKQRENGKTERNDRLITVAASSHTHSEVRSLSDLDRTLVKEIEHFFISYNECRGRKFEPMARHGPRRALKLVRKHSSG